MELLSIPRNVNFGLEIEINDVNFDEVARLIKNMCNWHVYLDYSCGEFSAEIVTPVLNNTKETWLILNKIAKTIKHLAPNYHGCNFQINYDLDLLSDDEEVVYFLKLFAAFEKIIFSYSRGYDEKLLVDIDTYIRPINVCLNEYLKISNESVIKAITNTKHEAICIKKDPTKYAKNLIEIRTPNGTGNIRLWQNYITFFYYLINFVNKKHYSFIDSEYERNKSIYIQEYYQNLDIKRAEYLANQIFPNEKDKTLFLNQYMQMR